MISRRNRVAALCGIVSIVAACTAPQDQTQRDQSGETITGRHGAAGIGDDYYPEAGNGGYDVENYAVTVRYDAESGHLRGHDRHRAGRTRSLPVQPRPAWIHGVVGGGQR